jgi:hypothetical protein
VVCVRVMNHNGTVRFEAWPGYYNISLLHAISRGSNVLPVTPSFLPAAGNSSSSLVSGSVVRLLTPDSCMHPRKRKDFYFLLLLRFFQLLATLHLLLSVLVLLLVS